VVSGLDAFSGACDEKVFRWELFLQGHGNPADSIITPEVFLGFFSDHVLLKDVENREVHGGSE